MPITFAHRGAGTAAPENTLEAFALGLELGATGIESDAHLSGDDTVVLVHDAWVRRGLRRARVATTSAEELGRLGIPRLVDLYASLGWDYELSIDLKAPGVGAAILEQAAARPGAQRRLWLCSPDADELAALVPTAGEAHLVHSTTCRAVDVPLERHAADLAAMGLAALNLHHREWSAGLVALFHRFELRAFAWDVQEVRHLRAMLAMGIDGVFSDRVADMVEVVTRAGGGRPDTVD